MHPRDRYITVYGRKPVLEALRDPTVPVEKVLLARNARGDSVAELQEAADQRGLRLQRVSREEVTRLSRSRKQDQGVVADVLAPRMGPLTTFLEAPPSTAAVMLLDGLTTPANVGLLLRSVTAAGLDGVVLPRTGTPEISPLVIKASAGVAFQAPVLRTPDAPTAAAELAEAGFTLVGLRGESAPPLFQLDFPPRVAFVVGGETKGVSAEVGKRIRRWARIPMANGVESLNAAVAGSIVAFEWARRR